MSAAIPDSTRAVVLEQFHDTLLDAINGLRVLTRPLPPLKHGQVLVKIEAAPCNPSDLLLLQGKYGTLKSLPTVPGWEGAGTVIASGGGLLASWLHGKRVACALQGDRDGTWSEYFVAHADECIPIKATLPFDQAGSLIINPLTAIGLLETAKRGGHAAAVHTAGASQLGRMLIVLAAEQQFPLINVVRRDSQVELLKSLGAEHVLNLSAPTYATQLSKLCETLNATAGFEAIAGESTGTLLNAMPPESTVFLYGALSETACGNIDPVQLIFHNKSLSGFYLGNWLRRRNALATLRDARHVQRMMIDGRIQTTIRRRLALRDTVDGLREYVREMTNGKVVIAP